MLLRTVAEAAPGMHVPVSFTRTQRHMMTNLPGQLTCPTAWAYIQLAGTGGAAASWLMNRKMTASGIWIDHVKQHIRRIIPDCTLRIYSGRQ